MNEFASFEPEQLVREITYAKTRDRDLTAKEIAMLKDKLRIAEEDPNIIRIARGEGRTEILNQIVADDRIVFGWGLKSQHAFHEQSKFRDFLEPNQVDINQLIKVVELYKDNLGMPTVF